MKPVIIFYAEEKDGKITITKEELQRIVDEAYRQGKADGNWSTTNPITVTPTWQPPYKITCTNHSTNDKWVKRVEVVIDNQPTADVRENVKGEWIHDEVTINGNTIYTPNAKCSVCDCYVFQESNFCPNCGADMRREKE